MVKEKQSYPEDDFRASANWHEPDELIKLIG